MVKKLLACFLLALSVIAGASYYSTPGGSVSIGGNVSGGTDNYVLFINPTGTLAESINFQFDAATSYLTLAGTSLFTTATNPGSGAGTVANPGSLAFFNSGGVGTLYAKFGAADTDWTNVLTGSSGWSLLGNAGTTAGTNFIGTTDAIDFVIKANNTERFRITSAGALDTTLSTGVLLSNSSGVLSSQALTNGQLIVGSTGSDPVAASLTGTSNQITVTPGAGSITLSTPQDIATTSDVTFDDITGTTSLLAPLLKSTSSGGLAIRSNGNTLIGTLGAGGGSQASFEGVVEVKDHLQLQDPGVGTNYTALHAYPGLAASYDLYFPQDDGSSNQVLTTDGSGNLSWTSPSAAGITALTGDVTATGPGSAAATIANNAVTDAKFRQSAGLSLVGRSANSTGNVADITAASDNQIFRRSGTSIGFGSIDLSQSNAVGSSVLPIANGGTNKALTLSAGGIPYFDADSFEVLSAGSSGQLLQSNGASAPSWVNVASATPTIFGSRGTPRSVVAATGITTGASHMSNSAAIQDIYVEGSAAGDNVCATINDGTIDGQRMTIVGRNDSNTLTFDSTTTNVIVNGSATLGANDTLTLRWDTSDWVEVSRNN